MAHLRSNGTLAPILKWAGGKRWQVPLLREFSYADRRFVEPFCGGLSVALGLQPVQALLNDVNPHLINLYRHVQAGTFVPTPVFGHDEKDYYDARERFNLLNSLSGGGYSTLPESAGLFYYLNRTGFNGLCRFNASGKFNVPFGRHKTITYAESFPEHHIAFRDWTFTCGDFQAVPLLAGDFVYADPPYDVEFTTYSAGGFTWADQERVAQWLARHDGPVVLCNQATPRILTLYADLGFDVSRVVDAPRRISNTGDRTPAREVIAVRGVTILTTSK